MRVFIFVITLNFVYGARILCVFPFPSLSHQRVFTAISNALSKKHEITVITTNPSNKSSRNLTEIDASVAYDMLKNKEMFNNNRASFSAVTMMGNLFGAIDYAHELVIRSEAVKELLKKPHDYFDLILVESHSAIIFGFQHKFKVPLIAVSTLGTWSAFESYFGNPIHPILYPCVLSEHILYRKDMSIWEKMDSVYITTVEWITYNMFWLPHWDKTARTYFGNDMPSIEILIRNISMLFLNVNPIVSNRKPNAPNVMYFHNVHSSHIEEKIPNDLHHILNNAKNGFVYFSLGTNVNFSRLSANMKKSIMVALGQLNYTVLCKWELDEYPGKPNNLIVRKWFPQQDILAHPKIKVFITQGGLQSCEEAMINAVPAVVIPFVVDQPMNAKMLKFHGMAETIFPTELTADNLRDAIIKVAENKEYRQRAIELRSIMLDEPLTGIEKIVWWCEYVIRHKGAKHLRSPGADIPLYEYFMIDLLAILGVSLFVSYKVLMLVINLLLIFIRRKTEIIKEKEQ